MTELEKHMREDQQRFYNNFVWLCKSHGISMRALTEKLEIATSPVTKWKNGAWPDTRTLKKIADYFNITIDELLGNYEPELGQMLLGAEERKLILAYRKMEEADKRVVDILAAKYED